MANIEDFMKLDLRIGKIVEVEEHPTAKKPMYKVTIDLGEELGQRNVVAGIRDRYTKEELIGKQVVCVVNLEPKEIAGITSNGMILAAEDDETLTVLTTDREVKAGSRIR